MPKLLKIFLAIQSTTKRKMPIERSSSDTPEGGTVELHPKKICIDQVLPSDHTYEIQESPRKLKTKLEKSSQEIINLKRKLKASQQKTRRLCVKVRSLKTVKKRSRKELKLNEKPWINSKIQNMMRIRDKILLKLKKKPTDDNRTLYKKFSVCPMN